jgi:acyl-CoA synthetase (NDP forming)
VQEMFDLAKALSTQPRMAGDRVGVVTSSGSLGALAIDACLDQGLVAATLSEETVARVRKGAPAWMNVKNPLDVGPSPQFKTALQAMLDDPNVDGVIAIPVVPFSVIQTFEPLGLTAGLWIGELGKIWEAAGGKKPLVVTVVGASGWIARIRELCGERVPVLRAPEPAAQALKTLLKKRG